MPERPTGPVSVLFTDFFSARMGCQVYHPVFGIDIAALCLAE